MSIMTKRERVLRTIRLQETDRVPLYDMIHQDAIIEHYAGEKLTVENGLRLQALTVGRVLDMVRGVGGPREPREELREDGIRVQHLRWTNWILRGPWHDQAGLVEWVKGEIKRQAALTFDRAHVEALHQNIRQCQAFFAQGDPTGRGDPTVYMLSSCVGLTRMYDVMGLQDFCYLLADEPDLVEEWLDTRHRAELRRVAAIANPELMPVVMTFDDLAYKNGPIFSPAWLRAHWMPRLRDLVEAWHARDTYCMFHSDGNLYSLLPDLVAAGIDGLNPLEVLAGMSVKGVRDRWPRLFLTGGIDVSDLLCFGAPEQVRAACRQAIADSGGRGYFLGSSTELHEGARLENAIAMFETAWETR